MNATARFKSNPIAALAVVVAFVFMGLVLWRPVRALTAGQVPHRWLQCQASGAMMGGDTASGDVGG